MEIVEFLLRHRRWDPTCLRSNIAFPEQVEVFKKTKRVRLDSNVCGSTTTDKLLRTALEAIAPEWWGDETQIVVNRNVQCARHVDANYGHSWILFLGDFTGGALVFESGDKLTQRRIWHKIYGRIPHWNEPHEGTKYSIIMYRTEARLSKHALISQRANAKKEKDGVNDDREKRDCDGMAGVPDAICVLVGSQADAAADPPSS